jgi:hypothetical protein
LDLALITNRDKIIEYCNSDSVKYAPTETAHEFVDGMYFRTTKVKAGTLVVGATHRKASYSILLTGSIMQIDGDKRYEISAPATIVTEPNTSRIAYALEDTVYMAVARTDSTDIEEVEEELYVEELYDMASHIDRQNYNILLKEYNITDDDVKEDMDKIGYNNSIIDGLYIESSKIHGEGVFTNHTITVNEVVGNSVKNGEKTILGRKVNHSEDRCNIKNMNGQVIALRDINKDEELLFNYKDNLKGLICQQQSQPQHGLE